MRGIQKRMLFELNKTETELAVGMHFVIQEFHVNMKSR